MSYSTIEFRAKTPEALMGSLMNLLIGLESEPLDPGNFFQLVTIGHCEDGGGYWAATVRHYQDSRFDPVPAGGIDWNAD